MADNNNNSTHRHRPLGSKINGGEIVEVQGGHIIRSTGKKDRHSKVCTAKGPRDRRVRLAAHTAIQFYDVQDRLGYDRPSKAVDWLIKKAQVAIDELSELPPWHPEGCAHNLTGEINSSILLASLDSDTIADTIKTFFPTEASSSAMEFHHFPSSDSTSRDTNNHHHHGQFQDLSLSLQSFQDPIGFDANAAAWLEQHHHHAAELSRFQGGDTAGYLFNSPQQLLGGGNSQFYSQRGPLQSSNTPSIRAWTDPLAITDQIHSQAMPMYPSSMSGFGFPGFRVPARIQGDDDEQHDGYSDKPSSGSSDSRH